MNQVSLSGWITDDIKKTQTSTGKNVVRFYLKVRRPHKKENIYDIFPIILWDNNALRAEKTLKKNSQILVCGELQSRSYSEKFITEIIGNTFEYMDTKENK